MPARLPRRRPARPARRDNHRIGRLEARLAVETDARRALADRVEALEFRLEAAAAVLDEHDAELGRSARVHAAHAQHLDALGRMVRAGA